MTGLERLKEIVKYTNDFVISRCIALEMEIAGICDQIEREHLREVDDVSGRDADILAWVEEHGGLAEVREYYECGRRIEPWNEQKADLYELMNACGGVEEIKNRLMPEGMEWPRFEDSEPVRFGDVVSDGDETGRVYYVTFDMVNPVIIGFTDETPDQDPGTWLEVSVNDGERVKRPAPEVLDADGVEIRVGDTVCGTRDMEPMKVVDTDSHECGFKRIKCEKEGDGFWFYCPDELTHRVPVLAADGKPLREGETVWGTGREEHEYVVLGQPGLGGGAGRFKVACHDVTDDVDCDCDPDLLTHERPDSWERLEEDADKEACEYFAHMPCGCETSEMLDETVEKCNAAKARDLVRRAKKLAGVE